MSATLARELVAHALPVLVAQLAAMGMMVVDTVVLGHVGAVDLAAVAIGGGIHIAVVFALVGILQALGPLVAHAHGAGRDGDIARLLQQTFLLALALSLPGILFLRHLAWLLDWAGVASPVADKVLDYLGLLAWGLPPALAYRTFYVFCNALGRPRILMLIGFASLLLHALFAWGFAVAGWFGEALGVTGCALSNVLIAWLAFFAGWAYLQRGPLRRYQVLRDWRAPDFRQWRVLLHLGLPMGVSNFVEITSFTLISLFIASLGATTVAGHRIVANLAALSYMLPLSLGLATLTALGFALGRRDSVQARQVVRTALFLAGTVAALVGFAIWLGADYLLALFTDDVDVRQSALLLVPYLALYQFCDALQTIAAHALRACRVTLLPMLMQTLCFWGIGLAGGAWLCYRGPAWGVAGFWLASLLSLGAIAALLLPLLARTLKGLEELP